MYYLFLIITIKTNDKVGISIIFTENVNLYIPSVTYLWLYIIRHNSHLLVISTNGEEPCQSCS